MVMQTGRLDAMTDDQERELLLVNAENELLAKGEIVNALDIDQHTLHIKQHRGVLADPNLRKDPKFYNNILSHINEHIQLLRTVDPSLLTLIKEQPLPPLQAPPPGPQGPGVNAGQMQPGPPTVQGPTAPPGAPPMPNIPHPAAPMQGLPVINLPPNGFPPMGSK